MTVRREPIASHVLNRAITEGHSAKGVTKHRRSLVVRLLIGILVAEFLSIGPSAQVVTGTILGTVRDTTGGVIPGTVITLTQQSTGSRRSVAADRNGDYAAPLLATGVYTLRAETQGFKTTSVTGIELGVDGKARVDLTLEVGTVNDSVLVRAENPLVHDPRPT